MAIVRPDGSEAVPTLHRKKCPYCTKKTRKGETVVFLRVLKTTPTEHAQIFFREYVCPKCGYVTEDEYVIPFSEDDYLTEEDLVAREVRRQRQSDAAKLNFGNRWNRTNG